MANELLDSLFKDDIDKTKVSIAEWVLKQNNKDDLLKSEFFINLFPEIIRHYNSKNNFEDDEHRLNYLKKAFKNWKQNKEESEWSWKLVEEKHTEYLHEQFKKDDSETLKKRFFKYYWNINTLSNVEKEQIDNEKGLKYNEEFIRKWVIPAYFKGDLINRFFDPKNIEQNSALIYSFSNKEINNPLNTEQLLALSRSHKQRILNIQGPPGTGKTTLLKDMISSLYLNNKTMIVASSNNEAVDNIHRTLLSTPILKDLPMIRLGNKQKMSEAHEQYIVNYEKKDLSLDSTEPKQDISADLNKLEELLYIKNTSSEEAGFFNKLIATNNEFKKILESDNPKELILEAKDNLWKWRKLCMKYINLQNKFFKFISRYFTKRKINKLCPINKSIEVYPFSIKRNSDWNIFLYSIESALATLYAIENYESLDKIDLKIDKIKENILLTSENTQKEVNNLNYHYWRKIDKHFMPKAKEYIEDAFTHLVQGQHGNFREDSKNNILSYYPIIFSTTLAVAKLTKNLNKIDYLIIDEAAQTSIHSVIGIMKNFNNIIFLGDTAQLSAVVPLNNAKEKEVFESTDLPALYRNINNSFPAIIEKTLSPNLSITLKEHWRCSPIIANFFNSEYYNNDLRIMVKPKEIDKIEFKIYEEASFQDLIPTLEYELTESGIDLKDVAIISPNKSVYNLKTNIEKKGTAHKFQGYENKIIICFIENKELKKGNVDSFLHDAKLVNVAVSRAKQQFILYVGDKSIKSLENSKHKDRHEFIKLITYIETINDPKSKINTIKTMLDTSNEEISEHTYSYFTKIEKPLYDLALKHNLNISVGTRDIDVNPLINNILDSKETYDIVIFNKSGVIKLILNNNNIIYKDKKLKLESKYQEDIKLFKVKNIVSKREEYWLNKIKKEMHLDNDLAILPTISFSKLLGTDYEENKMHADFVFAKKYLNSEDNYYYFKYLFILELDDATHERDEVKLRDKKKEEVCQRYKLPLLRVEI